MEKSGGAGRCAEVWHRVLTRPNWANYHGEATACDLAAEQTKMESRHRNSTSLHPPRPVATRWHLEIIA